MTNITKATDRSRTHNSALPLAQAGLEPRTLEAWRRVQQTRLQLQALDERRWGDLQLTFRTLAGLLLGLLLVLAAVEVKWMWNILEALKEMDVSVPLFMEMLHARGLL